MALWLVKHVLTTEDNLTKLQSDSYKSALAQAWYDRILSTRPGKGKKQEFEWLLTTAQIYKMADEDDIRFDDLVTQATSVTHEHFGAGIEISQSDFEDDAFDFAGDRARQLGSAMALDPQYAVINLMQRGETDKAYDGKAFYAKDHPVNPFNAVLGTYANLVDDMNDIDSTFSNATAPDLAATAGADYLVASIAYIKTIKMPNGKFRYLRPKILRVPPQLEKRAIELTSAAFIGATENVIRNYQIEVLVVNELASEPKSWHLDCVEGETDNLLPFVRFERKTFYLNSYNGMTQAELNQRNKLQWMLRGRFGHMYGHPYQSFKFKGA